MSSRDLGDRHVGDPDPRALVVDARREEACPAPGISHPMSHIGRCSSAYDRPGRPGHGLREPHAVLVREQVEVGVELGLVGEVQRAEPPPRHQVGRDRLRGLGAERPVGHVGHQVQPERRHPRDPRILDAGVAGPALPARVGLEHDAAALHADRHAVRRRPPRPARRARRCPRRPAAAAGAGARRACDPRPGSARPRPRSASPGSGDITTPARVSENGNVATVIP